MNTAVECNYNIEVNNQQPEKLTLSNQQHIDCNSLNNGCRGGDPQNSVLYSVSQGQFSEEEYPYTQRQGNCLYDSLIKEKNYQPRQYVSGIDTLCYNDGWTKRDCNFTSGIFINLFQEDLQQQPLTQIFYKSTQVEYLM